MPATAGWYPDPKAPEGDRERYWDGDGWTHETRDADLAHLPAPPEPPSESEPVAPDSIAATPSDVSDAAGDAAGPFTVAGSGGPSRVGGLIDKVRGSRALTIVVGIGFVLILGLIAGATGLVGDNSERVRGLVSVVNVDLENIESGGDDWDSCEGSGGYSDLDAGVPVRIENEDGKRIGAATLENLNSETVLELAQLEADGTISSGLRLTEALDEVEVEEGQAMADAVATEMEGMLGLTTAFGSCTFYWEADVEKAEVYNFDIGRRGDIDIDRDQLVEDGFLITFSIGD